MGQITASIACVCAYILAYSYGGIKVITEVQIMATGTISSSVLVVLPGKLLELIYGRYSFVSQSRKLYHSTD